MTQDASAATPELVDRFGTSLTEIRSEVRKIIVGQDEVVEQLLVTLLVGGHCLITGLPGTGKVRPSSVAVVSGWIHSRSNGAPISPMR